MKFTANLVFWGSALKVLGQALTLVSKGGPIFVCRALFVCTRTTHTS